MEGAGGASGPSRARECRPEHIEAFALWRRLDVPGHDACRLVRLGDGWRLEGEAVFREGDAPAALRYCLACDSEWLTVAGRLEGWHGDRDVRFHVRRETDGRWTLNGEAAEGLGGCVDLDLGVTPATNLSQLRRIALGVRAEAYVAVAWLDIASGGLEVLHQRYERRSETRYWYEGPRFGYEGMLEVDSHGFIRRYPGLWELDV